MQTSTKEASCAEQNKTGGAPFLIIAGEHHTMECYIDDGHGNLISGKQLARECIEEWVRILESEGLATRRRS